MSKAKRVPSRHPGIAELLRMTEFLVRQYTEHGNRLDDGEVVLLRKAIADYKQLQPVDIENSELSVGDLNDFMQAGRNLRQFKDDADVKARLKTVLHADQSWQDFLANEPTGAAEGEPLPPIRDGDKYRLGPGRTVTRGGKTSELSKQEFSILTAIKHRDSVPLGDMMRPAHDDAVSRERFDQDDRGKVEKIQKAISRLNNKLMDAGVFIALKVSPPDLIVTYT